MCIGYSIVKYFHAEEVVTLFFIALFSLLCGTFAGVFLYIILDACWLRSYLEKEVKSELQSRYNNIISVSLIALCSLIAFFGCFGKVVEKTWDDMDIGVRNDEWTSTKTTKRAVTHNTGPTTSSASQKSFKPLVSSTSSATNRPSSTSSSPVSSSFSSYSTSNEWVKRSEEPNGLRAFEKKIAEPKWQNAESVTPRHPLDDDFPPRRGGRGIATTGEPQVRTDAERITDSDWETSEGSEQEDFWITEEDDTTHNTTCDRYGEGEGMYSAVGSGTDCDECGGAR